jgi:hypothetical protein
MSVSKRARRRLKNGWPAIPVIWLITLIGMTIGGIAEAHGVVHGTISGTLVGVLVGGIVASAWS